MPFFLKKLNISVLKCISGLLFTRIQKKNMRTIRDPIYGLINIPDLCWAFINTPEFQRLRRVMQLGNTSYVFPSGVLTRYEHSILVMHICGEIFINLVKGSPHEDQMEYLPLVQLAALLHDLGHGPKSHLFEEVMKIIGVKFSHEDQTTKLLERLNSRLALLTEEQEEIVKAIISGVKLEGYLPFIFEIVANKDSGLDGDKMAYLQTDAYHLGLPVISVTSIIKNCRIDEEGHVSYSEEVRGDIRALFERRREMYKNVYFDQTVARIDRMWICAMAQLEVNTENLDEFIQMDDYELYHKVKHEMKHDIITCLENGIYTHSCDKCPNVVLKRVAKLSSDTNDDPLLHIRFYKKEQAH